MPNLGGADGATGSSGAPGNKRPPAAIRQAGPPGPSGSSGPPAKAPPILYGSPPGKPWPAGTKNIQEGWRLVEHGKTARYPFIASWHAELILKNKTD